jgi:RHS repeat-associated protein
LGSIRATVLDSAGAPVIGYDDYDPWGYPLALRTKPIPNAYLQGASKNKFTGKERDEEHSLNLDYFGGRYYDWLRGQWISRDPLAEKFPSWSPYVYALNNPLVLIDSDGQFPYTFHIRAFAPTGAFERFGFHDDRRGFSTGLDVTSRIKQSFTIDPTAQTFSGGTPTSDPTRIGSFSATATNKGGISTPEFGTNFFGSSTASLSSDFSGSNPLVPFAPNIEVSSAISITENLKEGKVFISLDLSSKQFPATEAFVQDNTGQKIFLAGAAAFGNPIDLINGKKVKVATADLIININKKGVFQNVTFGGKTYSLEEFNRLGTSEPAGPLPR